MCRCGGSGDGVHVHAYVCDVCGVYDCNSAYSALHMICVVSVHGLCAWLACGDGGVCMHLSA